MNKRFLRSAGAAAIAALISTGAWAQQDLSSEVVQQIASIRTVKSNFTPAQKKMDSNLAFGILAATNDSSVAAFTNAITPLLTTDVAGNPTAPGTDLSSSLVAVDIYGDSDAIAAAVAAANGTVISQSNVWNIVTATLPVAAVDAMANRADVTQIRSMAAAHTNVGALTSQGYISHEANKVVTNLGINGAGVKVGVLSDSARAPRVAALIASGDLRPNTVVLPGQAGPANGSDEGTAMMEIVQDIAPGAQIYFATAFTSEISFAQNILALAAAGCTVIVDDITYFDEGVFQDGPVQQAVNQVTAAGVVYLSSAGNSGSLTKNTSGTWEGDFKDGGSVTLSPPVSTSEGGVGRLHNFATSGTQNFDVLTAGTTFISLKWSDPLTASANDYDLYLLNATGTTITAFSAGVQSGTQAPYEAISSNGGFAANSRIVLVQYAGANRALHLDTERGALSIGTSGATFGHNAGAATVTLAATYWNSARTGTKPFTGFANTNETFSSDGPRKIFFNPNGTAITPGNFLFATNGGTTLQKPDYAAADGVSTKTPGFLPFFGTSASAPHAAGIVALIRQARPDYTVAQIKAALTATALDSMSAGADRDSGYGIATAYAAVQYAIAH